MAEQKKGIGTVGVVFWTVLVGGVVCYAASATDKSQRGGLSGLAATAGDGVKTLAGIDGAPRPQPSANAVYTGHSGNSQPREAYVHGYVRSDGTYVPPHYRTAADGDK